MTDSRIGLGRNGAGGTATLEDTYERVATRGHDDRAHTGPIEDAPTRELVGRIVNNFSGLVDKQVQLAKLEVKENLGEAAGDIKSAAIGAGIALAAGLLLTIWAWTGVIWLFNWVGAMFGAPFVGWIVGFVVPLIMAFVAWKAFIQPGLGVTKLRPLARTRETLKEDLEWLRQLRTPSAK
ncbi:MAG TPA: phage holin family protein [Gemmataceae bacterium]|nr:phage holin family protein [Gemmataceae bacterium]